MMIKSQLYNFVVVLNKALIEMREHCRYSSQMLSLELKVNKGNNAFQSSVGINELFQDMQLLGLLFLGGGNKVPNVAVCFCSLRVIYCHSLKGSVLSSRLWSALYSSMHPGWMEHSMMGGGGTVPFPILERLSPNISGKAECSYLRGFIQ